MLGGKHLRAQRATDSAKREFLRVGCRGRIRAPGGIQGQIRGGGPGDEVPGSSEDLEYLCVKSMAQNGYIFCSSGWGPQLPMGLFVHESRFHRAKPW